MKLKLIVPALVLGFLLPSTLFGWGREGHEIVARIAEAHLSNHAKAAVKDLLGDDTLVDVANWADEIRTDRPECATWHYIDIPYEMRGLDLTRDGKNGNNVVDKIVEFATVLSNPNAPRDKRVEALKFLVHFVGDIHQPLHCAERNDDKGGNMQQVFFEGERKAVNLHKVWDTLILKRSMKAAGTKSNDDYADKLNDAIDATKSKLWMGGNPQQWANESHDLAVRVAYADIRHDSAPKLTDKYLDTAAAAVDSQLQKGGIRLADTLNRIFP